MKKLNKNALRISIMLILCVFSVLLFKDNVKADTITWESGRPEYAIFDKNGIEVRTIYWLKSSGNYYCLEQSKSLPDNNTNFGTTSNMSYADSAAIIYIINNAASVITRKSSANTNQHWSSQAYSLDSSNTAAYNSANITTSAETYLKIQLGIWYYLNNKKIYSNYIEGNPDVTTRFLEAYDGFDTLYNGAVNAKNSDSFSVTISGSFNPTLNTTTNNYESGYVTVNIPTGSQASLSVSGVTGAYIVNQSGTTVDSITSSQNVQVIVPSSSISSTSQEITLSVSAKRKDKYIKEYLPSDDSVQSVGTVKNDVFRDADGSKKFTISNNYVKISKVDATSKKELPGATLQVLDSAGNSVVCSITENQDGTDVTSLSDCTWVSTTKPKYLVNLPAGEYSLVETIAPSGYALNKNSVSFTVLSDGSSEGATMENEKTTTLISKISAVNNKELPGATLQILNENKEKMSCKVKKENGDLETLDECTWVSTEEPTYVMGLSAGKYYLVETIAPKGYVLKETPVEFEVKDDGEVNKVEMTNELEVEVPDTLSAKSALLLTIAMFDIALGIGILTYVKKNKIEE